VFPGCFLRRGGASSAFFGCFLVVSLGLSSYSTPKPNQSPPVMSAPPEEPSAPGGFAPAAHVQSGMEYIEMTSASAAGVYVMKSPMSFAEMAPSLTGGRRGARSQN